MLPLDGFAASPSPGASPPEIAGCPIFPADNIWNTPVDSMPLDPNSAAYVATIGASRPVHPDFGSGDWPLGSGAPIGIPYRVVDPNQPMVEIVFDYADESDPGPYPIPADAPVEGGSDATGDRHVLVVDPQRCLLYELFYAFPQSDGSWHAGSGAVFNLAGNQLRPESWTSADAAGLPILPGLARYEEVAAGEIAHALRFTAPQTRRDYIWPARHFASSLTDDQVPPMGQRFRLRSDFTIDGFSPQSRVILRALQKYGMILADNGSAWFISGAPHEGWDNDDLRELRQVTGSDFEAVAVTALQMEADSAAARVPAPVFQEARVSADGLTLMISDLIPGAQYRLERRGTLESEDWSVVEVFVPTDSIETRQAGFDVEDVTAFYRISI